MIVRVQGRVEMCSGCRKLRYLPLDMDLCAVCWRPFLARLQKIKLTPKPDQK